VSPKLFGTSGIRGLANVDLTPQLALAVGEALASDLEGGMVTVGRDARLTGEMLESALVSGLNSCGADAKVLGLVPTPVLAFLTRELKADAGVAISASHNPPQYNGLKIFDGTGMAYTEQRQEALESRIEGESFTFRTYDKLGKTERINANNLYIEALEKNIKLGRRWRIAFDLFNGATGVIAPELFRGLGIESTFINSQPDGHFPSGNPEPTAESLGRLSNLVKKKGAELGFGFDGDGDRMMAIDEKGDVPTPDRVLAAYSKHVIQKNGGGTVVTHVGASMCVDEAVEDAGGSVIRTKIGDVSITEAMIENGAVFGGEPIGAWVHPEVHLCPDGILSALKLVEALESEDQTLSGFIEVIPEYPIMSSKVDCPDSMKRRVMKAIETGYGKVFKEELTLSTVDGVRMDLGYGWTLIRPSGTEPIMRITVEAREMKRAKALMERSRELVNKAMERRL